MAVTADSYLVLVVDDLRRFDDSVTGPTILYARNSSDAISLLQKHKKFHQVWMDHDLGEQDDTRPVVRWMLENRPIVGEVYVISMNPIGAKWVVDSLKGHYHVTRANNVFLRVPPSR